MYFQCKGLGRGIICLFSLSVWIGTAVPVFAQGATRDLPAQFTPGVPFTVSIAVVAPGGAVVVVLEDSPPPGWTTIGAISDEGVYDSGNHSVKWGPWFEDLSRTVTYDVTPPAGREGQPCWDGGVSFDGNPYLPIGGDECILLPTGACCDQVSYTCADDVIETKCDGPDDRWEQDVLCHKLAPSCRTVPAVSAWGLIVTALLVLSAGTLVLKRYRPVLR